MLQIQASNNISVISAINNTVVALIPVQFGPYGVTAHPNGNTVYVTNSLSNNVSVIVQYPRPLRAGAGLCGLVLIPLFG